MTVRQDVPGIAWRAASRAVQAAIESAEAQGIRVNAAVVDRGGQMIAFVRMPGAFIHSIDLAIDKAYTAASFGFPTKQWLDVIGHHKGLELGLATRPRLSVVGGGLPIVIDGDCIGGIGVSGGSEDEDIACAEAGLAALREA